jgi:hypothetical protein
MKRFSRNKGLSPNLSGADLHVLLAAVASSEIVLRMAPSPIALDFKDWCAGVAPADMDVVILDWLQSHRPNPSALARA